MIAILLFLILVVLMWKFGILGTVLFWVGVLILCWFGLVVLGTIGEALEPAPRPVRPKQPVRDVVYDEWLDDPFWWIFLFPWPFIIMAGKWIAKRCASKRVSPPSPAPR